MDTIAISKFKATCLAALERVRTTRRPLRVTRFGKAMVDIVPPQAAPPVGQWLGAMRDSARIVGDITQPSSELTDWDTK